MHIKMSSQTTAASCNIPDKLHIDESHDDQNSTNPPQHQ